MEVLWFEASLPDQRSFNNFLEIFKFCTKQVPEREGFNAIFFPNKSLPNNYASIFMSLIPQDQNCFQDLFTLFVIKNYNYSPNKSDLRQIYSDSDTIITDEENAHFM